MDGVEEEGVGAPVDGVGEPHWRQKTSKSMRPTLSVVLYLQDAETGLICPLERGREYLQEDLVLLNILGTPMCLCHSCLQLIDRILDPLNLSQHS